MGVLEMGEIYPCLRDGVGIDGPLSENEEIAAVDSSTQQKWVPDSAFQTLSTPL
jgi:hypothetical protein